MNFTFFSEFYPIFFAMKILYLHGLDSHLQDDRRAVLEGFAQVEAPVLDYLNTPNLFSQLVVDYQDVKALIGSSAGGLVAYYLAQKIKKPCLLFNPALCFRERMPFPISFDKNYTNYMRIVIGGQDEVIDPLLSLKILQEDISSVQNIDIHIINQMKHSYPIEIFSQECQFFFQKIDKFFF